MSPAQRLRAEFLAMVSHELGEPLTSIKGSITTLLEAATALDAAEVVQFNRIINSQTDLMREMVGDLLDVARVEMGTLSVSPQPIDVALLVEDARSAFQSSPVGQPASHRPGAGFAPGDGGPGADGPGAGQPAVQRGPPLGGSVPHPVDGSAGGSPGGNLRVRLGLGVLPERLPHLFRKLNRVEQERGDGHERAGLGLAICKGIVEVHGGRIRAGSDGIGQGARFTFTLPVAEGVMETRAARPVTTAAGVSPRTGEEQVRVLAVDDDPQTLRHVRDALTMAGYIPNVAGDPKEALPLVERKKPNLVLLDLALPGIDGIDLVVEIAGGPTRR